MFRRTHFVHERSSQLTGTGQGAAEASVWTVLKSFGYDVISAVNEEHCLDNLLTLSATMHMEFDSLQLWLEEVPGKVRGCPLRRASSVE